MNLPLNIDFLQVLLHFINFLILSVGLYLILYKPVHNFMEKRQKAIDDKLEEAEEKLEEANAAKAEYEKMLKSAGEKADSIISEANGTAEKLQKERLENIREEEKKILTEAKVKAESEKENILKSARTELSDMIVSAAKKTMSDVSEDGSDGLYDSFIKSSRNN